MNSKFDRVVDILQSDKTRLIDLAEFAGCDPQTFYRGCNLSGADLRAQDLSSISLRGAKLDNIQIDEETRFSEETQRSASLSFDLMKTGLDAIQKSANQDLVFEFYELLLHSVGLPRRTNYTPIKDTSPMVSYRRQVALRVIKCIVGLERNVADASNVVRSTKIQVWRRKKILVSTWEVLAFFNDLVATQFVLEQMNWDAFFTWRRRFMRDVARPPKKQTHYRVEFEVGHGQHAGFILIEKEPLFLQMEVLVWGLYFLHKNQITEDQLDMLTRNYYARLRSTFLEDMPPPPDRGVSF